MAMLQQQQFQGGCFERFGRLASFDRRSHLGNGVQETVVGISERGWQCGAIQRFGWRMGRL